MLGLSTLHVEGACVGEKRGAEADMVGVRFRRALLSARRRASGENGEKRWFEVRGALVRSGVCFCSTSLWPGRPRSGGSLNSRAASSSPEKVGELDAARVLTRDILSLLRGGDVRWYC